MARLHIFLALGVVILSVSSASALTPEERCQATKNKLAGKHALCRQKAEAKAVRTGNPPDFSKCEQRLLLQWAQAEQKALDQGGSCIDSVTVENLGEYLADQSDRIDLSLGLGGHVLFGCGDGIIDGIGEHCEGLNLDAQNCESLGFAGGTLSCTPTCVFDTTFCFEPAPFVCGNNYIDAIGEQCDGTNLAGEDCASLGFVGGALACDGSCRFDTNDCELPTCEFPASGETISHGPISDGHDPAGAPLAFVDNGDGTITDGNTGLMWEKKDDSGGFHDKDNNYSWCGFNCLFAPHEMTGTLKTVFLDTLNDVGGGGANCFAGYCDWRIPNYKELLSILDFGATSPAVRPELHQSITCPGCADVTLASCSCTDTSLYWSSTTVTAFPDSALGVRFVSGESEIFPKSAGFRARAVRGGP